MRFEQIKNRKNFFFKNKSSTKNRLIKSILFLTALLIFIGFSQTAVKADTQPGSTADSDVTVYITQYEGDNTEPSAVKEVQIPYDNITANKIDANLEKELEDYQYKLIRPSTDGMFMMTQPIYTTYGYDGKDYPTALMLGVELAGSRTGTNETNSISFITDELNTLKNLNHINPGSSVYFKVYYYDPIKIQIDQTDTEGKQLKDSITLELDPGGSCTEETDNNVYQGNTVNNIDADIVKDNLSGNIPTNMSLKDISYQDSDQTTTVTNDILNKDTELLKKYYSDTDSVSITDANAVINLLAKSFALTGTYNHKVYNSRDTSYISGSGNSGKTITIHLVYEPKKETNHNNSGSSSGSSGITRNIEGIELHLGTYKDAAAVKIYDDYGSPIADRKLAPGTNWYADEQMTINGIKYYRVATNQWIKASDIYIYYNRKNNVRVNSDHIALLLKSSGKKVTNRALQKNSDWYSDRYMYINNTKYYRVATNEFVSANDVTEY